MIESFGAVDRMEQAGQRDLLGGIPVSKNFECGREVLCARPSRKVTTVADPELFEEEGGLRWARHCSARSARSKGAQPEGVQPDESLRIRLVVAPVVREG
jgi:hypothetical protein